MDARVDGVSVDDGGPGLYVGNDTRSGSVWVSLARSGRLCLFL